MANWKIYKLCEVANLSTGFPFDGHKYTKEGQRVVRGDNITIGTLRWDADKDKRWNETFARAKEFSLQAGDIVIGMDGSRVGRNRAQIKESDLPLLLAQRVACIRHNSQTIQKFLYYQIFSNRFEDYIKSVHTGTSIPHVSLKQIGDFCFQVPDLFIQQRIANILSTLDDKIELNRRINENLEQQAQALFKSWFVDFEPFKDGKFVDSELGMIPEGWKVNNIYEYIDVIYGAPYKSSLFNTDKNGYPLIRIRDLKTYTPQFYTPEILPNTEYIYPGDVIAGMDAEFIPTLWLGEKGLLNQRCCKFISKRKNISNYYLLYLLMPELLCVQNYKTGTTVSHLGKADIDRFKVITPPIEIIEKFSTLVNPLYNEKIKLACENRIITNLRDALLPKLMSGELKLSEIETKLDE